MVEEIAIEKEWVLTIRKLLKSTIWNIYCKGIKRFLRGENIAFLACRAKENHKG